MLVRSYCSRLAFLGFVAALLLVALTALTAQAATQVYHSPGDDGVPAAGSATLPEGGVQSVYLYIDGGGAASLPGTACDSGQGDEICGYELLLTGQGGLTLAGFTPDAGANVVVNFGAASITINGLDSVAPLAGAKRIGELEVNAVLDGTLDLLAGEAVGADLSEDSIVGGTVVTVPEPGQAWLLISGLGILFALARLRGRRTSACSVPRLAGAAGPQRVTSCVRIVAGFALFAATSVSASPLIVNEFNAVGNGEYLNGGTQGADGDGNSIDPPSDTYFGRAASNGGDWIELVVIGDHLDIRGWKLVICDNGACTDELVFSQNAVWSDLRAGTILTVAEDVPTDLSFDSVGGDWWMNVQAENGGPGTYISPDNFPVSHNEWRIHIEDDQGNVVFGPIGEHVPQDPGAGCFPPQDDVNSGEIFRLEQDPSALIDPCLISLNDWEDGVISTFGSPNAWNSSSATQSFADLRGLTAHPDGDGDQIPDDGDHSGIAGDNPCVGGATTGCDDNCRGIQNAAQTDSGGPGGADGQGDVCQCGDPTGDDDVTAADVLEIRQQRVGLISSLTSPERCSVRSNGQCSLVDLVALDRAVQNPALDPGIGATCQAAAVPADQSELMFDPDRLIDVDIRIAQADWDVLRVQKLDIWSTFGSPLCGTRPWKGENDELNPYTFFTSEVTVDGKTFANVGVRKKGFQGSLSDTEPSLKVKFDEFVGGQQLNGMDRLTLNNNLQDDSNVKTCMTYALMRKAGLPAPRCNYAHVTVTVLGGGGSETTAVDQIYSHVESIKDPFLRRNFGSDNGRLYEGTLSDFWSLSTGSAASFRATIEPKSPEAKANTTEVDTLTSTLEDGGLSDTQRLAAIQAVVDYDAFLTFWAAEGMTGHWDGYQDNQNNFYFYVNPADGLIDFIPWGTDDTLGRGNFLRGGGSHSDAIVPRAALPRRLYAIPSVRAQYLARLQLLMDTVFDEAELLAEVDRIEALIVPVTGNITSHLDDVRSWINSHRASVQSEINSPTSGISSQPTHYCDCLFLCS